MAGVSCRPSNANSPKVVRLNSRLVAALHVAARQRCGGQLKPAQLTAHLLHS